MSRPCAPAPASALASTPAGGRARQVSFSDTLPSGLAMSGIRAAGRSASGSSSASSLRSTSTSYTAASYGISRSPTSPKPGASASALGRAAPATPPPGQSRPIGRGYVRSPYVLHARHESTGSETDGDVFSASPPGRWSAGPAATTAMGLGLVSPARARCFAGRAGFADVSEDEDESDKENCAPRSTTLRDKGKGKGRRALGDSNFPRSPGSESSTAGSPSASPQRKKYPLLDFSRTGTPLTAHKPFTPRRLGHAADWSPTKSTFQPSALGRKISLHGLGAAFRADESVEESEVEDVPSARMLSVHPSTHRVGDARDDVQDDVVGGHVESEDESNQEHPSFRFSSEAEHAAAAAEGSENDDHNDYEETLIDAQDSQAVDLALDLAGLTVAGGDELPATPGCDDDFGDRPGSGIKRSPFSNHASPILIRDSPVSVHFMSPPTQRPSVPYTPANGGDSDDSDAWVPQTRPRTAGKARKVLLSDDDDEEEPSPSRTALSVKSRAEPKGILAGIVPAAIRRLNTSAGEQAEERDETPDPYRYIDRSAVASSSDVNESEHTDPDDTMGSLRDFINDDIESESSGDPSGSESEDSYEDGAVSEGSLRDEWQSRARPRASNVFRRGDADRSNDSMGSLREYIEGDLGGLDDSKDYIQPSPSASPNVSGPSRSTARPSRSSGSSPSTAPAPTGKTRPKVIELLDSSDDEDEGFVLDTSIGGDDGELVADDNGEPSNDSDDGILHFSPPPGAPIKLPNIGSLVLDTDSSDDELPSAAGPSRRPLSTPTRAPRGAPAPRKKAWEAQRMQIAQQLFDELDRTVFDRKLGGAGAKATIAWSAKLRTSAGNASRRGNGTVYDGTRTFTYTINLSTKVLTTREQIINTLAHEMCHLATWVISRELNNPHGRVFKSWGAKVMRVRPDIEVTTKHDYAIAYKYSWACVNAACAKVYRRHSKSIDPARHVCARCRGRLAPCFAERAATGYQAYLGANMAAAKAAMPGAPHGEVMRALVARWKADPTGNHVAYWQEKAA